MESNEVGYFIFQHDKFGEEKMWPLDGSCFRKRKKKNKTQFHSLNKWACQTLRQTSDFLKEKLALLVAVYLDSHGITKMTGDWTMWNCIMSQYINFRNEKIKKVPNSRGLHCNEFHFGHMTLQATSFSSDVQTT